MEESWFVGFKVTLMFHCGNGFRMEVYSFLFKFEDMVRRKGKISQDELLKICPLINV